MHNKDTRRWLFCVRHVCILCMRPVPSIPEGRGRGREGLGLGLGLGLYTCNGFMYCDELQSAQLVTSELLIVKDLTA